MTQEFIAILSKSKDFYFFHYLRTDQRILSNGHRELSSRDKSSWGVKSTTPILLAPVEQELLSRHMLT
jgi:hypothetical protein